VNYMRNSVKVVIDAYDGSVTAYQADAADPLVRTLPRSFRDLPPARFHAGRSPGAFALSRGSVSRPDRVVRHLYWRSRTFSIIARTSAEAGALDRAGAARSVPAPHGDAAAEEKQAEFILMVPFTPRGKDTWRRGWWAERRAHYGELVVYRFPKQSLVFGPTQIVNRINQDTEIARQIACGIRAARR